MGLVLNKAAILAVEDIKTEHVDVPEWGGEVIIRELTGTERDSYEASMTIRKGDRYEPNPVGARARLVVRALIDEEGERLFKDGDATALSAKSAHVLDRLWDKIAAISGLTEQAEKDAEGNSESSPSDDSASSELTPPESP